MGRGRPFSEVSKGKAIKIINKQDRKDLKVLADDFGLLHRKDVREIIETCKSYAEGQRKIIRVYTTVYMR